jgi:hypothetical protein
LTTDSTVAGYRHEFLREYLGKVIIGLFIAIAIRNTASEASHAWHTRADELQRVAEATIEEFSTLNNYSIPALGSIVLTDPAVPSGTVYADEQEAVEHLAPPSANEAAPNCSTGDIAKCRQEYLTIERGRLTTHDLQKEVKRKLIVYHRERLFLNILLIGALFLQTWHLYYTFRTLDELVSASTPKYAKFSDSVQRKLDTLGLRLLLPLTLVLVIIPFSAPQNGSSSLLFVGAGAWSLVWCYFDYTKLRMLQLHRKGAHVNPKIADARRWIGEVDDSVTWMMIDLGLLFLFGLVLITNMFILPPGNDYEEMVQHQYQCIAMLTMILGMGYLMFDREWRRRGQREAPPMARWKASFAKWLELD